MARADPSEVYRLCEVSANCLNCPLPACKHDDLRYYQWWKRSLILDQPVAELAAAGLGALEIAAQMGITERTVYRALARTHKEM